MSRGRKRPEEESGGANWMDTYGDLVTLLLCLFVLLYSFSTIDAEKWKQLVGAFTGSNAISVEAFDLETVRENPIDIKDFNRTEEDYEDDEEFSNVENVLEGDFDALYAAIKSYIVTNELESQISVDLDNDIIIVRFLEVVLFDSGKAAILEEGRIVLNHIISIIDNNVDAIKMLRIEGHTDNVPIHTSGFESNWELSMARANAALKVFLDSEVIGMNKLSAAAYGEYQPVESNDTPEGRAANRRVDFVIEKTDAEQ